MAGSSKKRDICIPDHFSFLVLFATLSHENRFDNPSFVLGQMREIGHGRSHHLGSIWSSGGGGGSSSR